VLPGVAGAMLDALLDPIFTFVTERRLALHEVDASVIVPANAGRTARVVLQKLFRRRGFRRVTLVSRELAAAMALIDKPPAECVVVDVTDHDLHLHRVAIDGDVGQRRFRTVTSATVPDFGRRYWTARIAAAFRTAPSAAFDRALSALLTGSPDVVDTRLTHGGLQGALDDAWVSRERGEAAMRLLGAIDVGASPMLFTGDVFALEPIQRVFGATGNVLVPAVEQAIHGVVTAMWWLRAEPSRGLAFARGGTLRLDTCQAETTELVAHAHLPAMGESCHVETSFRIAGDGGDQAFLLHMLWGADAAPKGNETLCAMPLALRRGSDELRVVAHLRRGRSGRRIHGTVEARMPPNTVVARAQFTEELEVRK
jgi:hypothetical protein